LLRALNVDVVRERDEDGYRLDLSGSLPGGSHSELL